MIMEKISHPNQLLEWKSDVIANRPPYLKTIVISSGTCGQASGSVPVIEALEQELLKKRLRFPLSGQALIRFRRGTSKIWVFQVG